MLYYNAYTDGSFCVDDGIVHGGIVFGDENNNILSTLHVKTAHRDFTSMHNVGGEILAAWSAIFSVVSSVREANETNGLETYQMNLVYDYEGVGKWLLGYWKANKKATQWFKSSVKAMLETVPNLKLNPIWVKGHNNVALNEVADKVAFYDMTCGGLGSPICDLDEILATEYRI